jgi:uncharacterized protein
VFAGTTGTIVIILIRKAVSMACDNEIHEAIGRSGAVVTLRVKVVPGASRSRVVGMLGDRLKLSVSAAPEAGKANKAVCKLLAGILGVPPRDVAVTSGHTQPTKTITITGISAQQLATRLAKATAG